MARPITAATLGAWLLKGSPESNDRLLSAIDVPAPHVVTTWCVADSYRSRMMRPGDRALLWLSGNGRRVTRGIWGAGWVTGHVRDIAQAGLSPRIPLDIAVVDRGSELSSADLVAAGITDLEVQVQAWMSNPSWVTREQLERIEPLLGPWPPFVPRSTS